MTITLFYKIIRNFSYYVQALIADSGGPMFRGFVEVTLSTLVKLLLSVQLTSLDVLSCLGRVLSALITTVGPELQMQTPETVSGMKIKSCLKTKLNYVNF